jgi:hypothetical protein
MPNPKKPRSKCLMCALEPARPIYKYCSNACQLEYQYCRYVEEWKSGRVSGLNTCGIVTAPVKRFLRNKFQNQCCLCRWSQINLSTGVVPLVADHIDGNWKNNVEGNLRLLCPNCDSLTPTHGALNKGRGRPNRALSRRTLQARIMVGRIKT